MYSVTEVYTISAVSQAYTLLKLRTDTQTQLLHKHWRLFSEGAQLLDEELFLRAKFTELITEYTTD